MSKTGEGEGGVKATFGQCPKVSGFFLGMSSLILLTSDGSVLMMAHLMKMLSLVAKGLQRNLYLLDKGSNKSAFL